MMKSTITKRTYQAIYRLLNYITPLTTDCGKLCDAVCCISDDENMGIYLLPGEDKVFTEEDDWIEWNYDYAEDYDFPSSWSGKVYFVRCKTAPICPREKRPLQCRTFPLSPHIFDDGRLGLIWFSSELPYSCPLIENHMELEPKFIKAVHTVWKRLITDPLIYDLILQDSQDRAPEEIKIVYL